MSVEATVDTLRPRPRWEADAACSDKPFEWFLGSAERPLTASQARPGRVVCFGECAVRRDCLMASLLTRDHIGLRGGYMGLERRRALSRRKGSVAAVMRDDERGRFLVRRA